MKNAIVDMYISGKGVRAIAKSFDVTIAYVKAVLAEAELI